MPDPAPIQILALRGIPQKRAIAVIAVISAAMLGLLVAVIYGHAPARSAPGWISALPATDATFNAVSAVCLVLAYRAVRRRALAAHARYMLAALGSSALFLISYITYHAVHGDSRFAGHGVVRPVYFTVLISHVTLSALVLPLIFSSFFFSLSGRFALHKKVSRYTLPVWLYVSVTGVIVFALLKIYGSVPG
ncbi:MAG: DUF420 domain-containing protein [Polyangiaceae bacterium]